jgi:hypothetical protein
MQGGGRRFNRFHKESQDKSPFAKNPGVNAATADPPPDMRLKPPMRGEVDKNDRGRSKLYDDYVPAWKKPNTISKRGQDKLDSELVKPALSMGDLSKRKARNPNY